MLLTIVNDEDRLCEDCLEDRDYTECDECGELFPTDIVDFFELDDGRTLCQYCYEDYEEDNDEE